MLIQERDGTIVRLPAPPGDVRCAVQVEVPLDDVEEQTTLFDRLIEYAFVTLGVRYLEVRVTADDQEAGV
ncbi:MAG: hypothetical protein ACUVSY_07375 [Roseiflexus sp.]